MAKWYEEEGISIISAIPSKSIKMISHIGSAVILGIFATNIVDTLVEVKDEADLNLVKDILINKNWLFMNMTEIRITLNKGCTGQGFAEKVFHLYIRIP